MSLTSFLRDLGQSEDWEIRTQAAKAVGELTKLDFGVIYQDVIRPWATDGRAYVRAVVGYTLDKLIQDKDHDADAKSVLQFWSNPDKDIPWRYRWTAAAAYKQIGQQHTDFAFAGLKSLAQNETVQVVDATIYALVVLGITKKTQDVIMALRDWSIADGEPEMVYVVAFLVFINLSALTEKDRRTISSQEEVTPNQAEEDPPPENQLLLETLLLNDEDGQIAKALISILSRICKQDLIPVVFGVLRHWLVTANNTTTMQAVIIQIALALYNELDPNGRTQILNNILTKTWQDDDKPIVQEVGAQIKQRIMQGHTQLVPIKSPSGTMIVFG